ncbi:hypothetical protein C8R44DRAFT_876631 [Mycena epipterygia]|nr:hypothetical protein C8R44DRAFT_876631 [Mycena epipterygia]
MATIVLTIPSRGQVIAVPSGELVWRPPQAGALVLNLPAALLPPALLPPTLVPPVPDTIVERLCAQSAILPPNTMVYAPPLVIGERQACTLQLVGPAAYDSRPVLSSHPLPYPSRTSISPCPAPRSSSAHPVRSHAIHRHKLLAAVATLHYAHRRHNHTPDATHTTTHHSAHAYSIRIRVIAVPLFWMHERAASLGFLSRDFGFVSGLHETFS